MNGVRVDKRDLEPEEPSMRTLVDQLGSFRSKLVERLADVLDLVRDVVHPWAALGEKLPDRRLLAERGEQLDAVLSDPQRGGLDALIRHGLAVLEQRTEEPLVGRNRLVEVGDRDAQMMDSPRLHAAIVSG